MVNFEQVNAGCKENRKFLCLVCVVKKTGEAKGQLLHNARYKTDGSVEVDVGVEECD